VALLLGWFHWGLGLMGSAAFAREVAASSRARGLRVHYPLLGASAYMSMLLWHAGVSATAPLLINTPNHFLIRLIGIVPLSQTLFRPVNLLVCAVLLAIVPFVMRAMNPPDADAQPIDDAFVATFRTESGVTEKPEARAVTPAQWLDSFRGWQLAVSLLGGWFLIQYFVTRSIYGLTIDVLNFAFIVLGMALFRSPVEYAKAIAHSVRGTSGIVLQFPFYGAIMAMMRDSGLSAAIAEQFHAIATARTLPFFTFVASLVTKLFVPSGAGEWAVEGPVMLSAAKSLHASIGLTTLGVAYGNMAGNMYQPFWALPMLGVLGLRARDIMGYCLVIFCVAAPVLGVALWVAA
jgi:short-chain fatty acids transporter